MPPNTPTMATSSNGGGSSDPEIGDTREGGSGGQDEAGLGSQMQRQTRAEALSLRARGAELEEQLKAARVGRASARERREFMEEEAEQARDYGKKLAQEMSRLERIARTLPPDDSASVEKLRRLVATITEIEAQEQAALQENRAREAALRAEIDEFSSAADAAGNAFANNTDTNLPTAPASDAASPVSSGRGGKGAPPEKMGRSVSLPKEGGGGDGGVVLEKTADDPLAAGAAEPEGDEAKREKERRAGTASRMRAASTGGVFGVPRTAVVVTGEGGGRGPRTTGDDGRSRGNSSSNGGSGGGSEEMKRTKPALEGKALFALGLHRIEAAHEAAAAERDQTASRLSRLRLAVARRQREEDAAPGHAELLQYLLRFEELGRHSLERQEQLRRCRAERQTLALTRELLAKQARLLETVAGGVEEAAKGSKAAREAYLRQIKGIVEGVGDSLDNQTRLLDDVRTRRRAAEQVQASIKEDRKRFLAGTKELADECYRYEALNAHLALMRR